jgi:ribosomal protein S1
VDKKTKNAPNTPKNIKKGSASASMDDLLNKYKDNFKVASRGDKVKGTVTQKLPKRLMLDIEGKSEGIVADRAFDEAKGFIELLSVGDEVEGMVLIPESSEGYTVISLRQAAASASWKKIAKAKQDGTKVRVSGRFPNPSGVMVEIYGLYGFIPNSQLSKKALKDKEKLAGQEISAIVLEVDEESNRLIFSEKAVSEGITPELVKKATSKIKEGDVLTGKITTVSDFGCFVEITVKVGTKDIPLEGLVHVSELAWEKVGKPSDVVSAGDIITVKVIGTKGGRLALSAKQALKDPWEAATKKYKAEQKITGKVTKISDFGVFLQLEPGIEGLIHITKIPPENKFKVGEKVSAVIEELDAKQRKLSLGLILTQKPLLYK